MLEKFSGLAREIIVNNNGSNFGRLHQNTLVAVFLCTALVLLCYLMVDRPIAHYVHDQRFADYLVLKWLTYPPAILQAWVPVVLAALMIRRVRGPFGKWERVVVAVCLSLILAEQFKEALAYAFGRYWPETWVNNNPSLIRDGAYGFHPFSSGSAYRSFPSGHSARTLAVASIIWMAYPGWRWACGLVSVAVAGSLVLMDYHFVGDVIAGGFVGGIVGMYTFHCTCSSGSDFLRPNLPDSPNESLTTRRIIHGAGPEK